MTNSLTLDLSNELVNVVLVVGLAVVGNAELSVRGLGGTVAVGQIVDDDGHDLLRTGLLLNVGSILEVRGEGRDLSDLICKDFSVRLLRFQRERNVPNQVNVGILATLAA